MSDYIIQDTTLQEMADAIRAGGAGSSSMTPLDMPSRIAQMKPYKLQGTYILADSAASSETFSQFTMDIDSEAYMYNCINKKVTRNPLTQIDVSLSAGELIRLKNNSKIENCYNLVWRTADRTDEGKVIEENYYRTAFGKFTQGTGLAAQVWEAKLTSTFIIGDRSNVELVSYSATMTDISGNAYLIRIVNESVEFSFSGSTATLKMTVQYHGTTQPTGNITISCVIRSTLKKKAYLSEEDILRIVEFIEPCYVNKETYNNFLTIIDSSTSIENIVNRKFNELVDGTMSVYSRYTSLPLNIRPYAFYSNQNIKEFNTEVHNIGSYAFAGCSYLEKIPPVAHHIMNGAFKSCTSLKSLQLNVALIQVGAFEGCTGISKVTGTVNAAIYNSAFGGCAALAQVTLSGTDFEVHQGAFLACPSLSMVTLENCALLGKNSFDSGVTVVNLKGSKIASLSSITSPFSGTPVVYVPSSLYSSYVKNWGQYGFSSLLRSAVEV